MRSVHCFCTYIVLYEFSLFFLKRTGPGVGHIPSVKIETDRNKSGNKTADGEAAIVIDRDIEFGLLNGRVSNLI